MTCSGRASCELVHSAAERRSLAAKFEIQGESFHLPHGIPNARIAPMAVYPASRSSVTEGYEGIFSSRSLFPQVLRGRRLRALTLLPVAELSTKLSCHLNDTPCSALIGSA